MRCSRCNAKLVGNGIQGLCAVCLLDAALSDEPNETDAAFGYDLIEEIGRGGMGVVYRAMQHGSQRQVAVKMILAERAATPGMLERFRAEGEAIASLDHPHILPIYETGEIGVTPFYSMRFASGGTLRECVADFDKQPRRAATLMATVARAVHHAHERGILHRDLKPGNILLDGAERTPFVSDFGLAKWLGRDNRLTIATSALGTPHYIAPEQAAGASKELTPAADVYSLGAILYELLAGRPPFVADTPLETLRLAADTPPPAPRSFESAIPRDLEVICLKCLAKEPSARYRSAAALAEDLERWLEGRTILARPSTPVARGWRWTKRNPVVAALSGALLIVLLSFLIALFAYRHPGPAPAANTGPPAKSIAVLPFENLSHDSDSAYFAQGVQDEILTRLSKIADLKVISRTSTQRYKSAPENLPDIAGQLGVAHILEGSVQKSGDAVRVNVQLIKAANDSHLWADTFDRKLTDIFSVESEVAKAIADQLRVKLTGQEEQVIAAKPTDNPEAYDAYLRGLAYTLKTGNTQANSLGAQRYLREAVRLDPKFALGWALLSDVDSRGYVTQALQPTVALREEARQAAETALTLQPNLGEALLAKGFYHYACLKDYDTAVRYFEQARQFLPNNSRIPQSLAYVARRRGQWDRSELYFNEAERLDPRNVYLLSSHAGSYIILRRFPEALRKLEQVLNITPDDVDTIVLKAGIAQAEGDLPRASALLAPLRPAANLHHALQTQVYQAILERRPAEIIPRLKEILTQPDPALGFYNGELRFYLGWAQEVAGDQAGAQESWRQARDELEPFLKEQPENYHLLGDLALTNMGLGDKAAALSLAERAMAVIPIEKDPMDGPWPMEILARVAARMGEPDRAITALQKLLSIPYEGPLATTVVPLTPALLRLDPMFDPLRDDPRFEKLADISAAPPAPDKSIAVLPFTNLSDQQNALFASGVQDEILTHLAKIADLKVISRTSVMSYTSGVQRNVREIGQQLGVTHLLEGSVQRSGSRVRVNAQLIDARSDSHLWAQTYDRDLADVFAVQTEIARAISDQLQVKLSPAEKAAIEQPPTADLVAFDLYSRAKALLTQLDSSDVGKNNVLQAVALLEQAVERDPTFVEGYCQLASAHDFLYGYFDFDHTPARLALADAAVKTAQRLVPDTGEVHLALARHLLQGDGDFERARTELAAAQKTLPNAPDSFRLAASIDRRQGRWEECIRNLQRMVELDPRNRVALQQLAGGYQQMRRYPEADAALDRALALAPKNATLRVTKAALALISRADPHPLHSTIDSILAEDPGAAAVQADSWLYVALCERDLVGARRAIVALSGGPIRVPLVLDRNFLEGLLARVSGDAAAAHAAFTAARTEQEKVVRTQPDYGPAVCALGLIDAGLGRKEDALREGRRAVELVPLAKDAPGGALMIQFFAIICGWVGEKDLAFEQLAKAAALPGPIHAGVDYGRLRLHPFFDPLRSDPRFDKIVASLGPFSNSQAPAAPEKSIAVLPFLDLSQAKDQEYFCDGISEEILNTLAKVEGLQVAARTSSFSFKGTNLGVKEIAEKLGVRHILEGSLRREGNRIRITAQLVNASDGFHLWSETYERELQGVFTLQDEITRAITGALKVKLAGARPAQKQNTEAHDLYLQGVFFSNKSTEEGLRKSLEFFQRSLEKDPNSARAWAGIAKTWNWLADAYVRPSEAYPQMKAAAEKAIALDPDDAEAHIWMGESKRILDWDLEGWKAEVNRALQLDPNSATAHIFMALYEATQGNKDAAIMHVRESVRLDPLSPIVSHFAAVVYLSLGLLDEAIAEGKRTLQLDPNYIYETPILADAYREKGMFAEAIALFLKAQQITGAPQPGLAVTYARMGRTAEAGQILAELKEVAAKKYIAAEEIAAVYAALGEKDEAFKWLEQACDDHGGAVQAVPIRPVFRSLHSDPRFRAIVRRLGIDPAVVLDREKSP